MFATPPCKGQLRLAIVVAAETLPFVIGGSFCVKGRNCALDIFWEWKKFIVICSHLNPSSVLLLDANDLEDFRSLVTSHGSDAHVHICVDAQTGLGTLPPRPYSANIGTATTVSHRAGKRRIFESFVMEHLLTATNTLHSEDDGATDIYTWNYNGKYEPQQIDYIFSSDNSLRSRTSDSSATKSDHYGSRLAGNVGIASVTTMKSVLF